MSRYRNFSFILYPEDDLAGTSWVDWLRSKSVPCLAILHRPEDDSEKPHVHALCHFDNPTTRESAIRIFEHLHVPTQPANVCFSPVASVRGLERYFLHADSPDKIQYSVDELYCLCGYELRIPDERKDDSVLDLYHLACAAPSYRKFVSRVASSRPELLGTLSSRSYFFLSLFD